LDFATTPFQFRDKGVIACWNATYRTAYCCEPGLPLGASYNPTTQAALSAAFFVFLGPGSDSERFGALNEMRPRSRALPLRPRVDRH
jgi:hypothetical protein